MEKTSMHWIEKLQTPVIFGHRGASKYAPENTIAAFELAIQQGADAFELDTMLSADGIPVVIHDQTVDRTTNGHGRVDQLSAEKLHILNAGSSFSNKFSNEKIPLLEEVLLKFKDRSLINVELKNYSQPFDRLPETVAEIVNKINMTDQLIFSSFIPWNLIKLRKLLPGAHVALLCLKGIRGYLPRSKAFSSVSPMYINPYFKDISKKFIEKQHRTHRKVNTWVVNQPTDMIELINLGVDGIITNDPKLAYEIKRGVK
ncbi:MAG: hypothetical protein J7K66_01110 [Anaerolineaceae bacterium]|nr:hypothetical protein [Anaerolineaceae bacterium]